jgi:hypothetical protein
MYIYIYIYICMYRDVSKGKIYILLEKEYCKFYKISQKIFWDILQNIPKDILKYLP